MILGAHFDDEVVGTGGLVAKASEQGHDVTALIFCGGSSGRADHGLNEQNGWYTRLHETIEGGKVVGLDEVHVIVGENGIGLPEWFWGSDPSWSRQMANELGRRYNVHHVVGHHDSDGTQDAKMFVDNHPDHWAVGKITSEWNRSQWTDHHSFACPDYRIGKEDIINPSVHKYVVWPGRHNPSYNEYVEFDLPTAMQVADAIGKHRTQTVPVQNGPWGIDNSYALMSLMPKLGMRFGLDVNRPDMTFFEGYESTGGKLITSVVK